MTMWFFVIRGEDETEIHGKRYRSRIREFASKTPEIRGSVKNVKGAPEIEVRLVADDKGKASEFRVQLEQFLNSEREKKLVFGDLRSFEDDAGKYQTFEVIREDELTEMVWALQGAGDVFLSSSERIKELMVTRDLRKERGLLGALKLEVGFIREKAEEMSKRVSDNVEVGRFQFQQDCLRKALVEPAWADNDDFLQLTSDLFHSINREDDEPFESLSPHYKLKELENLEKIASEYYDLLDTRIKELDSKILPKHTDIKDD